MPANDKAQEVFTVPDNITAKYNFADTPSLGGVATLKKVYNNLTLDSVEWTNITGDWENPKDYPGLAGNKFSFLCGFQFESKVVPFPRDTFMVVFCPKRTGKRDQSRVQRLGWYIWICSDITHQIVVTFDYMMKTYKFDVNKFFQSNVFVDMVKKFGTEIDSALNSKEMDDLLANAEDGIEIVDYDSKGQPVKAVHSQSEVRLLKDSIKFVKEALPHMLDPSAIWTKDNWQQLSNGYWYNAPDVVDKSTEGAHSKTARNANAVYDLRNLDKARQAQSAKNAETAKGSITIDKIRAWRQKKEEERRKAEEQKKREEDSRKNDSHVSYDPSLEGSGSEAEDSYDDNFGLDDYDEYDN